MQSIHMELPQKYKPVEGPEGLKTALMMLLEKSKSDHDKQYFLSYSLNEQRSLIKVDMNQKPILFFFFDLAGRPAPRIVKQTIFDFLFAAKNQNENQKAPEASYDELAREHLMDLSRLAAHYANWGFLKELSRFQPSLQYSPAQGAEMLDNVNRELFNQAKDQLWVLKQQNYPDYSLPEKDNLLHKIGMFGQPSAKTNQPVHDIKPSSRKPG